MYQPMLFLHWKQVRLGLIPMILAAFGLPLLSVQGLGTAPGMETASLEAYRIVSDFPMWMPLFPMMAVLTGIVLALSAWSWDHQFKHVYALSLPLARWEYAMLKMGAGAVLALIPAAALWLGGLIAAASLSLPEGLNAYPSELALRFLLATLISYAAAFAMASSTVKTTAILASLVIGSLIIGEPLSTWLAAPPFEIVSLAQESLTERAVNAVMTWPGPFEVFMGNWTLIDV